MRYAKFFAAGLCMALLAGCSPSQNSAETTPISQSAPETTLAAQTTAPEESETEAQSQAPLETVKIRAAIPESLWGAYAPAIDAHEHYFAQEGLEVEWLKIFSGPTVAAGLISGDLDIGFTGPGGHTSCAAGSVQVVAFSHVGNSDAILVRTDSGIDSIEDIVGKEIITQAGTSGEVVLNLACQANNIDKESLSISYMDMTNAVAAFMAGHADVIATSGKFARTLHEKLGDDVKELCRVADFRDIAPTLGSFIATPEYIEEHEDIVLRFIRALYRCIDYRSEELDSTIQYCAQWLEVDAEQMETERDNAVNYTVEEIIEACDNGEMLQMYNAQLDQFLLDGSVTEVKAYPEEYLRTDLMKKAYETYR